MNLYWKAQIVATLGMTGVGVYHWANERLHERSTLPVTATVMSIDRVCALVDTTTGQTARGPCGQRADFNAQVSEGGKRVRDLDGTADVSFTYTAPQDGSFQSGHLHYNGHDQAFYDLKAGDMLNLRVDKQDPARFYQD